MSTFTAPNGRTQTIPDVYSTINVVSNVAGSPPNFNVACLIGDADRGIPYDVAGACQGFTKLSEVRTEYGVDSDLVQAAEYFFKHGGRKLYCVNASDGTKATVSLACVTPTDVIDLTAADYGSYTGDIMIEVTNNTTSVVIVVTDPDDSSIKVTSPSLTTLDDIVTWFNTYCPQYFSAVKHTGATLLPATHADAKISAYTGYVAGTMPAPDATDYDAIIDLLPEWINTYDIRLICPVVKETASNQQGIFEAFRDFAATQRADGKPVQVFVGGLIGDIVTSATDETNPAWRANALNSEDVIIVSPGIDGLDPYISSAPAVMGLVEGNSVSHNLTRDTILTSELETKFSTANLEYLIDGGVCVITYNKSGYFLAKGVNTYQSNSESWNVSSKKTHLPMQRAIADFVKWYFHDSLVPFVGGDGVTKNQLAAKCQAIWDTLQKNYDPSLFGTNESDLFGNGLPYNTVEIAAVTEGWNVDIAFIPANETNFIGLTVNVNVGY